MRDNSGAGVFKREFVGEGTKDVHLSNVIIVTEDAVEVSFIMQYVKFRK